MFVYVPPPSPERIIHQDVTLADHARQRPEGERWEVLDVEFFDCSIWGPITIHVGRGASFSSPKLDCDPDEVIGALEDEGPTTRPVFVDRRWFDQCRFFDVRFVVESDVLPGLRYMFEAHRPF